MKTELPPIIDDSWFTTPECDYLLERAQRQAARRPSPRAIARTRPFGKAVRKARASFNLAISVVLTGTLIIVAITVAANATGGAY